MNALIIGYGSIGSRHARLLGELGCHTAVVSSREIGWPTVYASLATALTEHQPGYIVIANATQRHRETLYELASLNYLGCVLIEKPLFAAAADCPPASRQRVFVAYNLRFHPLIRRLRELLRSQKVLSVQVYVGQYLPDWRPGTDYRASYSASSAMGGGVLRDLSHELDYLTWLFGGWSSVTALGGKLSALEIDSDDVFALLMAMPACPVVTLQLNYLDRVGRRSLIVNTTSQTLELDLVAGTLRIDRECENISIGRDDTYRAMHSALLSGQTDTHCTLSEGFAVMQLIEAAEQAVRDRTWVLR